MTSAEVEAELPYLDDHSKSGPVTAARRLDQVTALAFKQSGNVPDTDGRTLRLVLRADGPDPESIARRRIRFEPDYHEAPSWRKPGSKPVNVIPVRPRSTGGRGQAWWEDPTMAELETEWQEHGTAGGVKVPGDYRSFVFKTVAALRASGREVTPASIADSVARWVPEEDAAEIRAALLDGT